MRQIKITKSITTRESPAFDKYLAEIGKKKAISAEYEAELAKKIKKGDKKARNKLVNANLRFVISVAKKYQNNKLPISDLISEGNLGMIEAAEKFDETRGFKFISYAVWSIRKKMLQAISEQAKTVSLPLNRDLVNSRIKKAYQKLEQSLEREPSASEISEYTGIPEFDVFEFFANSGSCTSIANEEGGGLIDSIQNKNSPHPDQGLMHLSLAKDIDVSLTILTPREKDVIKMSFGIDRERALTDKEIASILHITAECARQSKKRALKKLAENKNVLRLLSGYLN